jgi:threonine synthase
MAEVIGLRDTVTGTVFSPDGIRYYNTDVGQVATLDVLYDYDALRQTVDRDKIGASYEPTLWRYRELLPVAPDAPVPPLAVGWTPLYHTPRLAADLGLRAAWVKDDGLNPTGSLKDRASIMVVARAMAMGIGVVSTASTGNAAAALAGVGASLMDQSMEIVIFVPAAAPKAKLAQLVAFGARVILVEGSYDEAFDLCYEVCQSEGWYCRNTGINPYTSEGKKTAAYEIAEQMGWDVPDAVMVSVGDGSIIGGTHKGFRELYELGWIERIPRLIGVQSVGSAPLVQAWENDMAAVDMVPVEVNTIADSISAGLPRDRVKALRAVRETGGAFVAVPDDEIIAAVPMFAQLSGVFAEPSCAVTYAGARRALERGDLNPDDRVVFLSTGNGLKDPSPVINAGGGGGLRVKPTIDDVRRALEL